MEPVPIGIQHDLGALYPQNELAMPPEARPFHIAIFCAAGAGESTLMRNMIADDIANGHGVILVDPHGQLSQDVVARCYFLRSQRPYPRHSAQPAQFPERLI